MYVMPFAEYRLLRAYVNAEVELLVSSEARIRVTLAGSQTVLVSTGLALLRLS